MPSAFKSGAGEACNLFGSKAFDAIPKATFAIIAWHLANAMSGEADADGAAIRAFVEEANALADNGIISDAHRKSINRELGKSAPVTA